jgi:peptidoglycan/LPS O-acetylase OafA/YrhL
MSETGNGYADSHFPIGEAVWSVAGIIILLVFGDVLLLLALTAVTVAMAVAWWTYRSAERRARAHDSELATVTQLRPTSRVQRDLSSAPTRWHGPSAA